MPPPMPMSVTRLMSALPPQSIVLPAEQLPRAVEKGDTRTFAFTMAWWEQLHMPFLAAADLERRPAARIEAYRRVIAVDYACELAHQKLAAVAREMDRDRRRVAQG
jgi:hypothetical protein